MACSSGRVHRRPRQLRPRQSSGLESAFEANADTAIYPSRHRQAGRLGGIEVYRELISLAADTADRRVSLHPEYDRRKTQRGGICQCAPSPAFRIIDSIPPTDTVQLAIGRDGSFYHRGIIFSLGFGCFSSKTLFFARCIGRRRRRFRSNRERVACTDRSVVRKLQRGSQATAGPI